MIMTAFLIFIFYTLSAPQLDSQQNLSIILEMLIKHEKQQLEITARQEPFSQELFYWSLRLYLKHPNEVYQQAILETGWFKSGPFKDHNNVFGMQYSQKRKSIQKFYFFADPHNGKLHKLAHYDHWLDATKDYALWQDYRDSFGYNLDGNYYLFLDSVKYATDKNYTDKLKKLPLKP